MKVFIFSVLLAEVISSAPFPINQDTFPRSVRDNVQSVALSEDEQTTLSKRMSPLSSAANLQGVRFEDEFEADIKFPERFKSNPIQLHIPTPIPHLHIDPEPVRVQVHAKRSAEKRSVGEFFWNNKFAILVGPLAYAGGAWFWKLWMDHRGSTERTQQSNGTAIEKADG